MWHWWIWLKHLLFFSVLSPHCPFPGPPVTMFSAFWGLCCPTTWNGTSLILGLPNSCSAFRSQLKCHFFRETPPGLLCNTTRAGHLFTPNPWGEHPLRCGMATCSKLSPPFGTGIASGVFTLWQLTFWTHKCIWYFVWWNRKLPQGGAMSICIPRASRPCHVVRFQEICICF